MLIEDSDAFWARTERQSNGCLRWTGKPDAHGYGRHRRWYAHRVAFFLVNGYEPDDGREVDHLCHRPDECAGGRACLHRLCVEPSHLEDVSKGENDRRGGFITHNPRNRKGERSHCTKGHEFTPENTRISRPDKPFRTCRTCEREAQRLRRST